MIGDLRVIDDWRRDFEDVFRLPQRDADFRHQDHAVFARLRRQLEYFEHGKGSRSVHGVSLCIGYSKLIFALCTTFAHRALSFLMRAANASGALMTGSAPRSSNCLRTSGSATTVAMSRCVF